MDRGHLSTGYQNIMYIYILCKTNETSLYHIPLGYSTLCTYVLCNIVISSLVHHVWPDDGLIEKGRNMLSISWLLTPQILLCFDLHAAYLLWHCTLHSNSTRRCSRKSEDRTYRVLKSWKWNEVVKKQIAVKVGPTVWERCYTKWGWTMERSERDEREGWRVFVVKRLLYSGNL
jgi:hypothetical protein